MTDLRINEAIYALRDEVASILDPKTIVEVGEDVSQFSKLSDFPYLAFLAGECGYTPTLARYDSGGVVVPVVFSFIELAKPKVSNMSAMRSKLEEVFNQVNGKKIARNNETLFNIVYIDSATWATDEISDDKRTMAVCILNIAFAGLVVV